MGEDTAKAKASEARERIETLIARVALKDRAALSQLYDLTQAKLFAVSLRVLGDRHAAEDSMHDTYVKIWNNADRFQVTGHSPMTWLITIARNTAIDRLRARRGHADVGAYSETLASSAQTPEQSAIAASDAGRIVECLDTLPAERRSAITGAYLDGRSYADLAAAAKVATEHGAHLASARAGRIEGVYGAMSETFDDDDMLAAELALGLLEGEALTDARTRATTDQSFAARVHGWEAQLARMADLPSVDAPASVKVALLADLFPDTVKPPLWQPLGIWQALAGGAVTAALLLTLVVFPMRQPQSAGPLYTAEIASEVGDFRVVAVVDKTRQEVILTRTLGGAPEGRILQVWAHGPNEPAQSVGLWLAGQSVRLALPPEIAAVQGTLTLGVSEEPVGGSPTGSPSGRVFGTVDISNVHNAL